MFNHFVDTEPLKLPVRIALIIWFLILGPWILVALMGSGMAFEGGGTLDAYLFIVVAWSYPPLVLIAWFFRRRRPALVLAPLLTLVLLAADQILWYVSNGVPILHR